jgi:hypothetical protein
MCPYCAFARVDKDEAAGFSPDVVAYAALYLPVFALDTNLHDRSSPVRGGVRICDE